MYSEEVTYKCTKSIDYYCIVSTEWNKQYLIAMRNKLLMTYLYKERGICVPHLDIHIP